MNEIYLFNQNRPTVCAPQRRLDAGEFLGARHSGDGSNLFPSHGPATSSAGIPSDPAEVQQEYRAENAEASIMSIRGQAYIAGVDEIAPARLPTSRWRSCMPNSRSVPCVTADCRRRTSTAISAPVMSGGIQMVEYLGLKVRHFDSTEAGGASYLLDVGHAAEAIAAGKCNVALITLEEARVPKASPPERRRASITWRRRTFSSRRRLAPPSSTCMRCRRRGTCTNSAPPASNSPGSRWPRPITPSTIRTPCCVRWSRSRM